MSLRAVLFHQINGLSRPQKRAVFLLVDAVLAPLAFCAAMIGQFHFGVSGVTIVFLVLLMGIAAFASTTFGLPRFKLNAYGRHAVGPTAKFAITVALGMLGLCQVFDIQIKPAETVFFGLLMFVGSVVSRFAMLGTLLWALRHGQTSCRVLIYGAGETGQQIVLALRNHQRIVTVGFLDDSVGLQSITVAGLPVWSPARLETAMRDLEVSRVLLALPSASAAKIAQITRKLKLLGLDVQALPSFERLAGTDISAVVDVFDQPGQFLGRTSFESHMPNSGAAYAGRVVLVSGAGGSVGSELCRQLLVHRPKALVLFERSEIALYTIERELRGLAPDVTLIPVLGSVSDARHALNTLVDTRAEVVFHAAAYKHVPLIEANPVAGLANNVIGTQVFADAAMAAGVARFVLISTDKAVRPKSVMGATKRMAEFVIHDLSKRSANTQFSTVRFGNVLGSSGSVLPLFKDQIARGGPVTLTHEDVTRYFMTIAEAARLMLMTGVFPQSDGVSDVFVLDMGRSVKIRDLAEQMIRAEGLSVKSAESPDGDIEIAVIGLRQGEKLHEDLSVDGEFLPTAHPKILRIKDTGLSDVAMARALNAAEAAFQSGDQLAARAVLARWVEGFPHAALGTGTNPSTARQTDKVSIAHRLPLAMQPVLKPYCHGPAPS